MKFDEFYLLIYKINFLILIKIGVLHTNESNYYKYFNIWNYT